MQYMYIDMQETIIFQWILRVLQKHYGWTDGRTDGPTDRRTDKPSYRDAIAASKNQRAFLAQTDVGTHRQISELKREKVSARVFRRHSIAATISRE